MENTNIITRTYSLSLFEGFLVEIEETESEYAAYLYHEEYGIKMLMYGMPKEQQGKSEFMEIVEYSVDDYIEVYVDEYMDD